MSKDCNHKWVGVGIIPTPYAITPVVSAVAVCEHCGKFKKETL